MKVFNDANNLNIGELMLSHPIIKTTKPKSETMPAYISGKFISDTLVGVLLQSSFVKNINFKTESKEFEINAAINLNDSTLDAFTQIKAEINKMHYSNLKQMLMEWSMQSKNLDEFKTCIEAWYNGYMERIGSQYKRQLLPMSLTIGIAIALFFNLSLFTLTNKIWSDSTLRNSITASAILYEHEHNNQNLNIEKVQSAYSSDSDSLQQVIKQNYELINKMGIPSGWSQPICEKCENCEEAIWPQIKCWLWHILGILVMGLALSWGSDNWFNILSKLIQIRGVIKPETSSKPKQ
jgi:hypothetical protein